jgi:hydroxypyruvate isomerase
MRPSKTTEPILRRDLLRAAALSPLAWTAGAANAALKPPPYTISINIELMFDRSMPKSERINFVASQKVKAFSFWRASEEEQRAMLDAQQKTGLQCSCVVGSGSTGRSTGLTMPGAEQQYFDELLLGVKMAQRFGGADAIVFPGRTQKGVPWETQRKTLVNGLRKSGDMAQEHGVYLTLEPLNRVESPDIAILTARDAFSVIDEVAHPHVKVDFDIYHLQLSEGNITNNLKLGLDKGWIRIVQIGDVPGRKEPGSGELNYPHIFRTLREVGYAGYLDTEHGTTSTPEHAIEVVKNLSLEY